ncbi:MAG: hypothetical protein NVS9B2_27970 [Steroidobacteraceae bacterium]
MRITKRMPNSNGVAPGQTATWDLPIGLRYHELEIAFAVITLAQMLKIRVLLNNEIQSEWTGVELNTLNKYRGRVDAVTNGNVLVIPFDRYGLYQKAGEEYTALQTASPDPKTGVSINSLRVEIDIDPATTAAGLGITLYAQQSQNDPARPGPGAILRTRRLTIVSTAAGVFEYSDAPKATEGPRYQFVNLAAFKTANTTQLEVFRDNYSIFERKQALNEAIQKDHFRVPQAGWQIIDPIEAGYDAEAIPLVQGDGTPFQDFRYKFTLSAGESIIALIEYIGSL